jgi:hypothetical protein
MDATNRTNNETPIMMTQQTLTQLRSLKLGGMGDALQEQLSQPGTRWQAAMTAAAPGCSAWRG